MILAVLQATGTNHKVVNWCLKYTGQQQVGNLSAIMFEKNESHMLRGIQGTRVCKRVHAI